MKKLSISLVFIITHTLFSRDPFSFGTPTPGEVIAHGVFHDLSTEFDVYFDKENTVHVTRVEKTVENKSPST